MISIEQNKTLAPYTTFRIGGQADFFCVVRTVDDLREAATFIREKNLPFFILGEGSNTLVSDAGFRGLVIKNEIRGLKTKNLDYEKMEIEVGAGENWDAFVLFAVTQKLYGVENLSWIPGTVGAAPVQNIGAYGAEVKEVIDRVEALDMLTGAAPTLTNAECQFAYRESIFKKPEGRNLVVTKVYFVLQKNGKVNIGYKDLKERFKDRYSKDVTVAEVRDAVIDIRTRKLPDVKQIGTAGSFFKNPFVTPEQFEVVKASYPDIPSFSEGGLVKIPLAWILDKVCNLRGWKNDRGTVGTYATQPLALVHYGGGTFSDVEAAAAYIASLVREKTGIEVEWEVRMLK